MSPLWQTPISNYIHFSNITFFGFIYGLKVVAKSIAEHTSIFQTPFVQSRALSITYLLPCQRNPGVIMPKNQVHPITPQAPGLLGNCPCRTPGPLAFGAAGHRWGPQGEQNADKADPVRQQNQRRWCPGASEPRESRKKPGGEGDGAVSGRLRLLLNLVSRPWWGQCNRIYRQDQLRLPAFLCRRKFVGVPKATCLATLRLDVDEQC